MKILSIQVGKPKTVLHEGEEVSTGIFKDPVSGPVFLKHLGLTGDGQADLRVHGGRDKALYAYPCDTYPIWKSLRPKDSFPFGALGENLTVDRLPEDLIYIGDTYELGQAIVQVTQPRYPCYKLGIKFNDSKIIKQFNEMGRPGVYFRVLKEGSLQSGDEFKLISRESTLISVIELLNFSVMSADLERVNEMLKVKSLPESWLKKLQARLDTA